jgi:hypothetical protein
MNSKNSEAVMMDINSSLSIFLVIILGLRKLDV